MSVKRTSSVFSLLSNSENCELLKYFGNVYCDMTNQIGDLDTRANHKVITIAAYTLVISRLIGFLISSHYHFQNISDVHGFLTLTVKGIGVCYITDIQILFELTMVKYLLK